MKKLLKHRVVLVTGGGSGTGRQSAILFAHEGAKIIIANRRKENGEETVQIIKNNNNEAIFIQTDISKENQVINLMKEIELKYGKLDCAFNCGGIAGKKKEIINFQQKEWNKIIDINLRGTFLLLKHEINQMLKQKERKIQFQGTIVNMASVSGILGRPQRCAYNASRSGIISLTKTAAIEYIKKGIRINSVSPGAINTELFNEFTFGNRAIKKQYAESHPIGRIAEPEEIANAVLFLLSDMSSFIVGHNLVCDGGATII